MILNRAWSGMTVMLALLASALFAGGCSCSERIQVMNDTHEMLHVQVQLPKPDVPWACGCKCVYETLVGPGALWTAARPGSPDQMDYPPEPYSDCGVVRARAGTSGTWTRYRMCGPLVDKSNGDPIVLHITPGGAHGLSGTAVTASGKSIDVAVDETDH